MGFVEEIKLQTNWKLLWNRKAASQAFIFDFVVQLQYIQSQTEQKPFSCNFYISTKKESPEIQIVFDIGKVSFGLNRAVYPKQAALWRGNLLFHSFTLLNKAF